MIRLTSYHNGSPIYVPADVVIKENYKYEFGSKNALPVTEYKPIDGAMVVYDGVEYSVKESPAEVARKVLEWKLAMEDFKACLMIHDASTSGAVNKLHNLAGLEAPKDEG